MEVILVLAIISGIILLGFLAEIIFKKTNIPDVLFLIIVGILIGTVFEWTDKEALSGGASLFTTFALIFILFQGALSIDFRTLVRSLPKTLSISIVSFLLTMGVVAGISILLGYDLLIALLIGSILAGTSSAVVIPVVNSLKIREQNKLVLTLESAISDVLCIIGTITILEIIRTGAVEASSIFNSILSSFSLALIVGTVVGIFWVFLLNKHENLMKAYIVTIAIVVGLYAFVESPFVNASGAIAALAFGLVLGNSRSLLLLTTENQNSEDHKQKKKEK